MFFARFEYELGGYVQQLRPHSLRGAMCAAQWLRKESSEDDTPMVVTLTGGVVCRYVDGKWCFTLQGFKYSPAYKEALHEE